MADKWALEHLVVVYRCGGWALNIHEGTNIKVERDRSGLLGKIVGTISKVADKVSGPFIDLAKVTNLHKH